MPQRGIFRNRHTSMTRPAYLKTKIFLDGGDPAETRRAIQELGFLDGQTTNPTLIAKNPDAKKRLEAGQTFSREEIMDFYRGVVGEIAPLVPEGSVSVEVYADTATTAEDMFTQGKEMFSWLPNAHIKYPTTKEGLIAAERSVAAGMRVNMTLCFTEAQAAAVYAATRGAKKGDVFVSPFVGRLDDRGENGMDLIKNIQALYQSGDGHVEVLVASVRSMEHFKYALALKADIITAPFALLGAWAAEGMPVPEKSDFTYPAKDLAAIPPYGFDLSKAWTAFDIRHPLTDKGIERFAADWNALIA